VLGFVDVAVVDVCSFTWTGLGGLHRAVGGWIVDTREERTAYDDSDNDNGENVDEILRLICKEHLPFTFTGLLLHRSTGRNLSSLLSYQCD
jgi:hypothetical protein